jgi:hypothetical protein
MAKNPIERVSQNKVFLKYNSQFAVRELFWTHGSILAASPLSLRTKSIQIHPVGTKRSTRAFVD